MSATRALDLTAGACGVGAGGGSVVDPSSRAMPVEQDRGLVLDPSLHRLVASVAADPAAPLLAALTGPGGSGKTTALGIVARRYRQAGVEVACAGAADRNRLRDPAPDAVLLVDDAQHLDAPALDRLRAVAETGTARLVVAYRPWPRNPALSALVGVLGRSRPPVVFGRLDPDAVAARAAALFGAPPAPRLVELVREETGGHPGLVDLLVTALREAGCWGRERAAKAGEASEADGTDVPEGVLERLRHDLDRQEDHVRGLLLARAAGADLDVEVLALLLEAAPAAVLDAIEAAQATGLLADDGQLLPLVRRAVLRWTPAVRLQLTRQRLAEIYVERGGSLLGIGRALLHANASGARVAAVLARAGDEALRESAPLAARLYQAAVVAGAPAIALAARRAEAAALCGHLDEALRLADQVVADPASPDRARGITVAAAVVAHRGLLARSAELYRWTGVASPPPGAAASEAGRVAPLAVPALIGTGALAEARQVLSGIESAPAAQGSSPTLVAGAESLMAQGMYDTVAGSPTTALSALTRAAVLLEPAGPAVLLPDTPAALAALVALHCGELDVASSALDRAVATDLGGPAARARHRLLQAWIAMLRGDLESAAQLLAVAAGQLPGQPPGQLEPRDELVAAALGVALARRRSDVPAMTRAWHRAREAIVRHPVDLYSLQPLGELAVAAGRLGEQRWVAPHLAEAQDLLRRLGNPVLWAAPLHWFAFHAAIAAEQPPDAVRHAAALREAASTSSYAARLVAAARCWLRVLAGEIDVAEVEGAARGLQAVGLAWEGSRLAGQAAIRAEQRTVMTALLSCARALQPPVASPDDVPREAGGAERTVRPSGGVARPGMHGHPPAHNGPARPAHPGPASSPAARRVREKPGPGQDGARLSSREREVAELLLAGLTHKQIGERLFISPKTVEHHVSRMRQRFGSATRGELFSHLRLLLDRR